MEKEYTDKWSVVLISSGYANKNMTPSEVLSVVLVMKCWPHITTTKSNLSKNKTQKTTTSVNLEKQHILQVTSLRLGVVGVVLLLIHLL